MRAPVLEVPKRKTSEGCEASVGRFVGWVDAVPHAYLFVNRSVDASMCALSQVMLVLVCILSVA